MVETQYGPRHKVQVWWQLGDLKREDGKTLLVVGTYTLSLNEKASLRKRSWT